MTNDSIPLTHRLQASSDQSGPDLTRQSTRSKINVIRIIDLVKTDVGNDLQDLKRIVVFLWTNQKKTWIHIGLFSILLMSVSSSGLSTMLVDLGFGSSAYCTNGGEFVLFQDYNPWTLGNAFQITIGFGKLTFAQAKAIDAVWDVVVGRGGQFCLTAVCFQVFTKSLNRMLEQSGHSISYDGFRAIVFEQPSLSSALKLIRSTASMVGWRSKASIAWMIFASLYVVAYPTITSTMTGYSSNVTPYFKVGDDKVPVAEYYFHRAIYRITDAYRIDGQNLSSDYVVGSRGFGGRTSDPDFEYAYCLDGALGDSPDCDLAFAISRYLETYGPTPLPNITSSLDLSLWTREFNNTSIVHNRTVYIQPPTLNIEVFNTTTSVFGPTWKLSMGPGSSDVVNSGYMYTTTNSTTVYTATNLQNAGTCDNEATYNWGFSFILLFSFFVATGVWTLGMYVMWNDAFWNCRLESSGRKMGFYRGVADISNAMWKDSLQEPRELASESQIRDALSAKLNGGRVGFDDIHILELPSPRNASLIQLKHDTRLLSGWTNTWTRVHWMRLIVLALSGFIFTLPLMRIGYEVQWPVNQSPGLLFFYLAIAIAFWFMALLQILKAIVKLVQSWHQSPHLNRWATLLSYSYWIWTIGYVLVGMHFFLAASAVSCAYSCPGSPSQLLPLTSTSVWLYILSISYIIGGPLWLSAGVMMLVGLFSTTWRWAGQIMRTIQQSRRAYESATTSEESPSPVNTSGELAEKFNVLVQAGR